MADARFQDGEEGALRLLADSAEDVAILATLLQDAVLSGADLAWDRRRHRFAALVNRFRWEDQSAAESQGRRYERVRSLLTIECVTAVRSQGIARKDAAQILSILDLSWAPGAEGAGCLTLVLAGDAALALDLEAIDLRLEDVTKPHYALASSLPQHGE